ncbi:cyclin-D-binding Myb-like transcription factor 1 isoform X2 [Rhinoderma darwinii]|uniref:cyclin-D-binding Myb-like transcription factor 1 isoform X2 n=1 Tax=Rhinoderma darwinii TaxID=43563 RepID=UPI003F664C22
MSTAEDESGTVKVQSTRNALTLTQDLDGNLILHCPQNVSEQDQSFEVTMTATTEVTEDDISEDSITQIQILQNEQLADISPAGNDEVSAVSRAWFTSKEDKDSLTNKGHRWKQGMWSKEEISILMSNIERYLKAHGIKDATEIIFEMSKDERKDFYRTIAWGLNRPLFAVYRRVLRMYDDRNHVGKYTHAEIERLRELRVKHGNDWATIGAALGRSASSVKDRCRLMKETCKTGKWTDEEERRLTDVVHELTGTETGDIVTQGVSWASVAERVGTRSEKQCRSKWLNYLNWKQSGGTLWTKEDEINLILRIAELGVLDENDINWDLLAEGWSSVRSPQWLRSKWWTVKRQIANHKDVCFPASPESSSPNADPDSLSTETLQTFEILPSFYLQPSGTSGTFILQTSSSQSLPLTLTSNQGVTLTSNTSPASPEQIIVHALSPENLLNASDNVTVHCHTPGIIIRTLASDDISSPLAQSELSEDCHLQQNDLHSAHRPRKTDCLPQEMHCTDINVSRDSLYCIEQSINMGIRARVKRVPHPGTNVEDMLRADIKTTSHIDLVDNYVKEDLRSSALEEHIGQPAIEGTVLIVPSCHSYIQSDDIDGESVLPLTTLADPILQLHRDRVHRIDSSIDGPDSDDSKDIEDL